MSAPFSRASAIGSAEAIASQLSQPHSGASAPLTSEAVQRSRVDFIDAYDSRWQRDPGRANGPFS